MPDKVIHEVRFIETDDGFRIEVKGDKERLREMFKRGFGHGPGRGFPFGPAGFMRHHRRHPHGPWRGGFPFGRLWGPPGWGWEDDEESEPEPPQHGPAADRGPDSPRV